MAPQTAAATRPRPKIEAVVAGAATAAALVVPKAAVAEPTPVAVPKGNAGPGLVSSRAPRTSVVIGRRLAPASLKPAVPA